jgi:hypothetical protein
MVSIKHIIAKTSRPESNSKESSRWRDTDVTADRYRDKIDRQTASLTGRWFDRWTDSVTHHTGSVRSLLLAG